jgi:hypothetical protein
VTNHCGSCRACCRGLGVTELEKPEWKACKHQSKAHGCKIYATRPLSCQQYECLWLSWRKAGKPIPPQLRPDRCGVIFDEETHEDGPVIVARVAPESSVDVLHEGWPLALLVGAMEATPYPIFVRHGFKTSGPIEGYHKATGEKVQRPAELLKSAEIKAPASYKEKSTL